MRIQDLHTPDKALSAKKMFSAENGDVISLHLLSGGKLKEHSTKTPALLICTAGEVVFENEKGRKESLSTGEYLLIEPLVKHWVNAIQESDLLLIK